MPQVTIVPGPIQGTRCTFTADGPLESVPGSYRCVEDAAGVPLAQAVLAVPGVAAVEIAERAFTVERRDDVPWERIEEPLRYAVTAALERQEAPTGPGWSGELDDDAMYDLIAEVFDQEINPSVASHGGKVELIDVQEGVVTVRMLGGCQGCGMASVTLKQGIEGSLRRRVPGLQGIEDVTDHAAGTNPYFSASKK